jgi:hypothetical protein
MSNVKAREIPDWPSPADENARFFGQPGDMIRSHNSDGTLYGFFIACPRCGQFGVVTIGSKSTANWVVIGGTTDDVTTLSLQGSILKHCCGWHGHLTNGEFVSCK